VSVKSGRSESQHPKIYTPHNHNEITRTNNGHDTIKRKLGQGRIKHARHDDMTGIQMTLEHARRHPQAYPSKPREENKNKKRQTREKETNGRRETQDKSHDNKPTSTQKETETAKIPW
jgi:hypothetical protein